MASILLSTVGMTSPQMDANPLASHHAELDRRIRDLTSTADGGDCHDLMVAWGLFEKELLRHFELEERKLFARFGRHHPAELATLIQDHATLRRDLLALGVQADLHCLRAEAVAGFLADLRAHATREEQSLYRWADTLDDDTWSTIARGLREVRDSVVTKLSKAMNTLGAGRVL